jgi:outer membrane protein OmpA-like peptidoglycan-associated protein
MLRQRCLLLALVLACWPCTSRAEPPSLWAQTAGLSAAGGIGLHGLPTAEAGLPWQLRAGLWLTGFAQSNYLIDLDRHSALSGALQLDATLGRHVELWLALAASSHRNQRPVDRPEEREDPPLILALGDLSAGLKLHGQLGRAFHGALHPHLKLYAQGGDLGPSLSTVSAGVDALGSLDLRRLNSRVPLRLHARIGYLHDRGPTLLDARGCREGSASVDECMRSRIVTQAAYGIHQPRVRFGLGADLAFAVGRHLVLGPLFEYHIEVVTAGGDPAVRAYLQEVRPADEIDGRVAQWLQAGLRLHTAIRLTLDAGVLFGLDSPGHAMGPPVPQVAGYGALTFVQDLVPARYRPPAPLPIVRPQPEVRPVERPPAVGTVRGTVRDRRTSQPLRGAVVRFIGRLENALLTDERGSYHSPPLPPGPIEIEASRDGYEPERARVGVVAGDQVLLDVLLDERPPPPVTLRVDVMDDKGLPLPASVSLTQPGRRVDVPPDIAGGFLVKAPPGSWTLRVESQGYLAREQPVVLGPGPRHVVSVVLRRRPTMPGVRLQGDMIVTRSAIHFAAGTAELTHPSTQILDEIADLLLHHPELRRVRIEGHTDSAGRPEANQKLSEERAITVRNYLVRLGVSPERLVAVGLGATRPLMPNLSPSARAKNRRIEFRVLTIQP